MTHSVKITVCLLLAAILAWPGESVADEVTVIATDEIEWGLLNPLRGDFFSSAVPGYHRIEAATELVLYLHAAGRYTVQ